MYKAYKPISSLAERVSFFFDTYFPYKSNSILQMESIKTSLLLLLIL